MIIEETILIHAPVERVWKTFTDLTCWKDWNRVLKNVSPKKTEILSEGGDVRFCIYPFKFPVYFEPVVEEVILHKRIVWNSGKYGVSARHEFIFEHVKEGTLVISREVFKGIPVKTMKFIFPKARLIELTVTFLNDLKKGAESRQHAPKHHARKE